MDMQAFVRQVKTDSRRLLSEGGQLLQVSRTNEVCSLKARPGEISREDYKKLMVEIHSYVSSLWNDSEKREQALESVEDIINENFQKAGQLRQEENDLKAKAEGLGVCARECAPVLEQLHSRLEDTFHKLQEMYEILQQARKKGWKIIFYPQLAFQVLKLELGHEEERRQKDMEHARRLFQDMAEKNASLQKDISVTGDKLAGIYEKIGRITEEIESQKQEIIEFKLELVRLSNSYVCYSLLGTRLEQAYFNINLAEKLKNQKQLLISEEEAEQLLTFWEIHKAGSAEENELLNQIMNMLDGQTLVLKKTELIGLDIGEEFDDSIFVARDREHLDALYVRSCYIVDAITAGYRFQVNLPRHGGWGGSYTKIDLSDTEIAAIEGKYGIPFVNAGGDAVSQLVIETRDGHKYGPFGKASNGTYFKIVVPEGKEAVALAGKTSDGGNGGFITKLGLVYK